MGRRSDGDAVPAVGPAFESVGPRRLGRRACTVSRSRRLIPIVLALELASVALAQSSQPTADTLADELPSDVRAALERAEDFAFNFDQPGFYAVVEFLKRSGHAPGFAREPIVIDDWRDLLERPGDYRGQPVTVAGIVGRNKAPYTLESRPTLGPITQLELSRDDQPLTCTVILTQAAADIPLGATLHVTGYFIMVRQYHGRSNRVQQAALIVAPGPTTISRPLPSRADAGAFDWRWALAAVGAGLAIAVVLIRQSARNAARAGLGVRRPAPDDPERGRR